MYDNAFSFYENYAKGISIQVLVQFSWFEKKLSQFLTTVRNRKSSCVSTRLFHLRVFPLQPPGSLPWETIVIPWHTGETVRDINLQKEETVITVAC